MKRAVITATGLWVPEERISNEELVACFNTWVDTWNAEHANEIAAGNVKPKELSDAEFIENASGIRHRYVVNKQSLLDPKIMAPRLPERRNEDLSLQAEVSVAAAQQALENVGRSAAEIDAVICSCSTLERSYPAIAIEVQNALGASGLAFDMSVGCASALYGLQMAQNLIAMGQATRVLVVNPEICTGHIDYRDRESHFIFGDACTAILIEEAEPDTQGWEIVSTKLVSKFSNNIRNNFGYLNRATPETQNAPDKLMKQKGRKVFREVVPIVTELMQEQLERADVSAAKLRRLWLHQANAKMNRLIASRVLEREPNEDLSPTVLGEYGNTSSAGSIMAFHMTRDDLEPGDVGLICAFGAGYAAGAAVLKKTS